VKITMTLSVPEPEDIDATHPMGITNTAYDRLYEAVTDAGFEFVDGPDAVEE
jgi:hypothetical protein